jgi:hypothetical protein
LMLAYIAHEFGGHWRVHPAGSSAGALFQSSADWLHLWV